MTSPSEVAEFLLGTDAAETSPTLDTWGTSRQAQEGQAAMMALA